MSEPPSIPYSFLAGAGFFASTALCASSLYAISTADPFPVRYAFGTTVNVGVAGACFTGASLAQSANSRPSSVFPASPRTITVS
jgi:hypothetical protein